MISFLLTIFFFTINLADLEMSTNILLNYKTMESDSKWRIVNDGVMGGLSTSRVELRNGDIIFSGDVSLKNNGGFASLRSPVKDYNFSGSNGFKLNVLGDGKIYSISMKETEYFSGYFYTADFITEKEKWTEVKIPFAEFSHYYFGRNIESNPKIPLNNIKEVSLVISNKQEGNFEIKISNIHLY